MAEIIFTMVTVKREKGLYSYSDVKSIQVEIHILENFHISIRIHVVQPQNQHQYPDLII